MIDLNELYVFGQVVERKGFASAGRALNLPKSTVKRQEGMHVCADARQYKFRWVLMCEAHDIASRNYTNG